MNLQLFLSFLKLVWNFLKPFFVLIGAAFLGYREAKKNYKMNKLDNELDSIRRLKHRRAKRDSDSISVVTNRLRTSARKE